MGGWVGRVAQLAGREGGRVHAFNSPVSMCPHYSHKVARVCLYCTLPYLHSSRTTATVLLLVLQDFVLFLYSTMSRTIMEIMSEVGGWGGCVGACVGGCVGGRGRRRMGWAGGGVVVWAGLS